MMSKEKDVKQMNGEQKILGIYRLITNPTFYAVFQKALGARHARSRFFSEWAITGEASDVLDVGCGPGTALPHIKYNRYTGIDLNANHIHRARATFAPRTVFEIGPAQDIVPALEGTFDVILAVGFLHHLNEDSVSQLLNSSLSKLRIGGSAFFLEPVWLPNQRLVAQKLMAMDSGQHIRTAEGYASLLDRRGFHLSYKISDDLLRVPYDHFWGRLLRHE